MSKATSEIPLLERASGRSAKDDCAQPSRSKTGVESDLLALQCAAGNRAVGNLLRGGEDSQRCDMASVHIHAGTEAGERAHAMGAAAFTSGQDVYLGEGVDLATELGHRVLAHELTHVIQQQRGRAGVPLSSQASLEGEAAAVSGVGSGVLNGIGAAGPGTVQRITEAELEQEWRRLHPRQGLARKPAPPGELATVDEEAEQADREAYKGWREEQLKRLGSEVAEKVRPWTKEDELRKHRSKGEEASSSGPTDVEGWPIQGPADLRQSESLGLRVKPRNERQPSQDWASVWNRMTPEQRAKVAHQQSTSPKERWEASKRPKLPQFLTEVERSLHETEQVAKKVPFLRSAVSFAQAGWGEDIVGQPVSPWAATKEGVISLVEDALIVLGPEDLIIGGGEDAAKITRELEQNISKRGIELGPEVEPIEGTLTGSHPEAATGTTRELEANVQQRGIDLPEPGTVSSEEPLTQPVAETIPKTEPQTVSVTSVEAPEPIGEESFGATEQASGEIPHTEKAPSSRTTSLSPEEIQHKLKTKQANEKTIRRLERQLQNKESRGAERNPENVKRQVYELKVENEQLIEEVTSMSPARPGEPLRDLEYRWFKQKPREPLNVYQERIAAKREMVEEEALRHENRLELLDRYDELERSLERRSKDLKEAEVKAESAAREYADLRREWWSAKKTASDAGEAFPRKSSKELFERDLQLEDDYQTARRRLNEAEQEVRRAQFGITNTGDIAEKSIARDYLLDSGFENIRSVQNPSGHGIDIVATRKSDGKTIFFEVKGSETSRAGRLSERQKDATAFVTGSVEDLSPKDQQELLAQIGSGKVEGYVLEITDINLLARQGKVKIRPW